MAKPDLRRRSKVAKGVNPRLNVTHLKVGAHFLLSSSLDPELKVKASNICARWKSDPFAPGDLEKLVESVEPGSHSHTLLRQFRAFIAKVPMRGVSDPERAAITTWWACESMCRDTNSRIGQTTLTPDWVGRAQSLIRNVIGSFTDRKYREILRLARHGKGTTIGTIDRERTSPVYKSLAQWTVASCTQDVVPMAIDFYKDSPNRILRELTRKRDGDRVSYGVDIVRSNRVAFVPKTVRTHRAIAVEPSVNIQLQLGVHYFWTPLFEKKGVATLSDQTRNQEAARLASAGLLPVPYSTIDLSSASDTLSIELVKLLIPEDWYEFLDLLRCRESSIRGQAVKLEKFSSMGNGFTFALETLIFWAICRSVCLNHEMVWVYGDDMIIPTERFSALFDALTWAGFSLNVSKSFKEGCFRESCGADWSDGRFVTPVYLHEEKLRRTDIHRLLNLLPVTEDYSSLRCFLIENYTRDLGPLMFGLENEDTESCVFTTLKYLKGIRQCKWSPHLQNWRFRVVERQGVQFKEDEEIAYLSALVGTGERSTPKRGGVRTRYGWQTAGKPVGSHALRKAYGA